MYTKTIKILLTLRGRA